MIAFGRAMRDIRESSKHTVRALDEATIKGEQRLTKSEISRVERGEVLPDSAWLGEFLKQCGVRVTHRREWESERRRLHDEEQGRIRSFRSRAHGLRVQSLRGGVPTVMEVDEAHQLGVHASIPLPGAAPGLSPTTPLYVERDIDSEIDRQLAAEGFVLLVGDSASGKSRSAYEAIRRNYPDRYLVAPEKIPPTALAELVQNGLIPNNDFVVWLDDLDYYLNAGAVSASALRQVLRRPGAAVLATIRTVRYHEFDPSAEASVDRRDRALIREGHDVLRSARHIHLGASLSEKEHQRAQTIRDPRIVAGMQYNGQFGLTAVLAAVPTLWQKFQDRWATGISAMGAAIVEAAIDCRRAGFVRAIDLKLLEQLTQHYLIRAGAPATRERSAFHRGLEWATQHENGTAALLSRAGSGFEPFDYLVDQIQRDPDAPAVPALVWEKTFNGGTLADQLDIALAAFAAYRKEKP